MSARKFLAPDALDAAVRAVAARDAQAALCGGYAMQLWGSRHLTGDLDVIVAHVPDKLGPTKPLSFGGVKTQLAGVPVDFIVRDDDVAALYVDAHGVAVEFPEVPLRVVRPEWLVSMKLYAGRPKDEAHISELIRLGVIDRTLARAIARKHLGVYAERELKALFDEADWRKASGRDHDEDV